MLSRNRLLAAADLTGQVLRFDAVAELKAAEAGAADKRPTFKMRAYTGGAMRIDLGGPIPVVADLAGLTATRRVAILLDHDRRAIVGQATKVEISERGVDVEGVITGDLEDPLDPARKVVIHARNGFEWPVSIGAPIQEIEFIADRQKVSVNGRSFVGPVYVVRKATLAEVSFVSIGGDDRATTKVAAAAQTGESTMDPKFKSWLTARGKDPAALSAQEIQELQGVYDAELAAAAAHAPAPPAPSAAISPPAASKAVDEIRAQAAREAVAAERQRHTDIEAACRGLSADVVGDLKAKAVAGDLTVDGLRQGLLDRLRESRPRTPAVIVARGPENTRVLEAALCLSHRVGTDQSLLAAYGEQILNQADRYRRAGLRRIAELCAGLAGVELGLGVDTDWMRAAFSTTALPGILGNVAYKALAQGFAAVRAVAPRIARAVSHVNFHTHTVYSLALSGDLEEVAPGGELKHLALSEESWTRQLKTRGAVLGVTRQDVINDELGAFVDNGARLGRKAAVAREKATFVLLNATGAGDAHFTVEHKNYQEGAATALTHAGLTSAVQLFRDQVGPDGDPVQIEPRILLVPTALEEPARALMDRASQLIAVALAATGKVKEPAANVWAGAFDPAVSEWLGRTIGKVAGSSKAWYLLADPADVAAIELAYLNGLQEPVIEFFGLDQNVNVLGVTWRVFYDFGVALGEHRAGVKSKGEA